MTAIAEKDPHPIALGQKEAKPLSLGQRVARHLYNHRAIYGGVAAGVVGAAGVAAGAVVGAHYMAKHSELERQLSALPLRAQHGAPPARPVNRELAALGTHAPVPEKRTRRAKRID